MEDPERIAEIHRLRRERQLSYGRMVKHAVWTVAEGPPSDRKCIRTSIDAVQTSHTRRYQSGPPSAAAPDVEPLGVTIESPHGKTEK